MIGSIVLFALLLQEPAPAPQSPPTPVPEQTEAPAAKKEAPPQLDKRQELLKVRRIFVESFGTSDAAQQLQAMIVTSLTESNRFTVTENKEKADAILKGFAGEKTYQETHAYGSGTAVSTAAGAHSSSISGSGYSTPSGGSAHVSGSSSGGFHAAGGAIEDSSVNTETIDNAKASVRLVNQEGDVIWTSTQESKGAKFKGASADVADKIVKQLLRDVTRAEKPPANTGEAK
ncbi:MAG TPA: hypothetical protein VN577_16400 [Terriglobales bacterium]|nr:hypothetical protein [Terriglobales bacterium]